jgi:glyoxylase-like metal-dependent hydrolase (beta-lactamase superfamily II)
MSKTPMHPTFDTPLEDELGDVIEKAMRRDRLTENALAAQSGVEAARILDAIDYRSDLACDELRRLAAVLRLNEVGLCALAAGRYPLPETAGLPFDVRPLRMPHGIGVVNAYLVAEVGAPEGILFDTGAGMAGLEAVWPEAIRRVAAVFLTHVETEHAGGLCEIVERFGVEAAFVPEGSRAPCGRPVGEGEVRRFGSLEVAVLSTPGHSSAHNCYLVRSRSAPGGKPLLVSGDMVFAGSAGGGYFSHRQLETHLRRVLAAAPPSAVIAPGHGPLTTVEDELRYNPFLG